MNMGYNYNIEYDILGKYINKLSSKDSIEWSNQLEVLKCSTCFLNAGRILPLNIGFTPLSILTSKFILFVPSGTYRTRS